MPACTRLEVVRWCQGIPRFFRMPGSRHLGGSFQRKPDFIGCWGGAGWNAEEGRSEPGAPAGDPHDFAGSPPLWPALELRTPFLKIDPLACCVPPATMVAQSCWGVSRWGLGGVMCGVASGADGPRYTAGVVGGDAVRGRCRGNFQRSLGRARAGKIHLVTTPSFRDIQDM